MIATLCRGGVLAGIAVLLSACSTTPPSTHYMLTAAVEEIPATQSPAIGVGPIEIPEYLNRNTVVYRGPDNELVIDRETRWAEPLEDGIGRVVSLNLAGLLDTGNLRNFPWNPKRPPDVRKWAARSSPPVAPAPSGPSIARETPTKKPRCPGGGSTPWWR